MMKTSYRLIDTRSGLVSFIKALGQPPAIAVDLEADSMFHFKEKVCLIQMAAGRDNVIIDPIRIKDLSVLQPLFADQKIRKIFHGADYDVRSLYRDFKIEINNLFDTQIACAFLGLRKTGLDAVLKEYFNVRLDKKYQRKDWSIRPLPLQMIEYAAADVIYLIDLAGMLATKLKQKGRLAWVSEESEIVSNVRPASPDDQPLYLKFRGAGRLDRRSLAVLEALLQFRVRMAKKKNRPPFKILGHDALLKASLKKPADQPSLVKSKAFSAKQVEMYGDDVVEIVDYALKLPENKLPVYPKKRAPRTDAAVPQRVKALKAWRDKKVQALEIDSGVFFSNHLISTVAVQNPANLNAFKKIPEIRNWQKREFGREILAALKNVK